ncbi:MAG TPA: aromatic ring-hydroxylating dioxygenase subunit alpha [Polyangium sp.]|nr:aromatic ring-hydroxylating dioxygenase subunit alpha [Polyangium sp.]
MFEGFARVWTPVTVAKKLEKKPLGVMLAGEKLVFFRNAEGQAQALIDRCPHRGVKLSLGRVTENGCLECPFHAWQFDGCGKAVHIPLNPDAKRENYSAMTLPVREVGGVLWVYTDVSGNPPPSEPLVPDALTNDKLAHSFLEVEWNAHWTRAMENMLDSPHVPFLHATTIGRFVRPHLKPNSRMDIEWEDTDFGGVTQSSIDGAHSSGAKLEFYKPNMMVLHIPVPNQTFRMHSFCVPSDRDKVRMMIIGARSFARLSLLNYYFNSTNAKIAEQDRAVVESSDPVVIPPAAQEQSVRTDRATLRFRKYYFDQLAKTSVDPPKRHLDVVKG